MNNPDVDVRELTPIEAHLHDKARSNVALVPELAFELSNAHTIILHMLSSMTPDQQSKLALDLDALGISGEGATRYHERAAVLAKATPISTAISSFRLNDGTVGGTVHMPGGKSADRELPADSRRLNWLEENPDVMIRRYAYNSPRLHFRIDSADGRGLSVGSDLRTALDVAMIVSADEARNDLPACNSRDDLVSALQAIIAEASGPARPYSADSYLPQHLTEAARAALAKAGAA